MKLRSIIAGTIAIAFSASLAFAQTSQGTSPLTGSKGGTNNAFMQFTGPATSIKTFTLPNVSDTIATLTGTQVLTNKTMSGSSNTLSNIAVSSHAAQAAYTFIGNNSGSSAVPTAVDIAALTTKASPAAGDYVILSDQAASGAWKKASVSSIASAGSVGSLNGETGALVQWGPPQGRLTLSSNTPVIAASQTAQTTIYYTSTAAGKNVPVYNGTTVVVRQLCAAGTAGACELSVALGSNWATNNNHDWFVGLDSSTLRLCSGPDWSAGAVAGSNTVGASTRGTGAGSTELENFDGLLTNKNSMTCRYGNASTFTCAAHRCTFVGSSRTGAAGQLSFTFGTSGVAGTFNVWNAYNQELMCSTSSDSTSSWTYNSATIRQANASTVNQFNFMSGLAQGNIDAIYSVSTRTAAAGAIVRTGLALNSTTTFAQAAMNFGTGTTNYTTQNTTPATLPGQLGANFISGNESGDGTNSMTFIAFSVAKTQQLKVCMFM